MVAANPDDATLLLKNIGTLLTLDKEERELSNAAIHVTGKSISWVGPMEDLPQEYAKADKVLDMTDYIVLPGLVNTHHHTFQNLTRCVAQEVCLVEWLTTLYPAWEKITGSDLYIAAVISMAEMMLSGCTTSSDHTYIFPNDSKLDDSIKAARDIGMRFHPTRGGTSIGPDQGGYGPQSLCEDEKAMLDDMKRLITTYHDNSRYSMLRIGLAPTALLKCTPEFFKQTAALAEEHPGVRLHSHLAEISSEIADIRQTFGCSPSEHLRTVGWDGDKSWFAHCVQLSDQDIEYFREKGMGVAHCPSSNMRLASGIARVREMLAAGVNVGLGTDGSASNDAGNLLYEARLAMFLQRSGGDPTAMNSREAVRVAVRGGAKNLGRTDIGSMAPGYAADIIAFDTTQLGFSGAMMDPIAALVHCCPGLRPVDISIINGRIVVMDGQLTTIDLKEAVKKHGKASARLCSYLPSHWKTGIRPQKRDAE